MCRYVRDESGSVTFVTIASHRGVHPRCDLPSLHLREREQFGHESADGRRRPVIFFLFFPFFFARDYLTRACAYAGAPAREGPISGGGSGCVWLQPWQLRLTE